QICLVARLARRGGNRYRRATQFVVEVTPKASELAYKLVPTATVIAAPVNLSNPYAETSRQSHQWKPFMVRTLRCYEMAILTSEGLLLEAASGQALQASRKRLWALPCLCAESHLIFARYNFARYKT